MKQDMFIKYLVYLYHFVENDTIRGLILANADGFTIDNKELIAKSMYEEVNFIYRGRFHHSQTDEILLTYEHWYQKYVMDSRDIKINKIIQ